MDIQHLSAKEIAQLLRAEFATAPPIHFYLDAASAFHVVGLLQLALSHPVCEPRDTELVRRLVAQLEPIGPATATVLEMGFDPESDDEQR
jgi:hypothetical protein